MRSIVRAIGLSLFTLSAVACGTKPGVSLPSDSPAADTASQLSEAERVPSEIGKPLSTSSLTGERASDRRARFLGDPIVVPDCRLTVIAKEEAPSQREGVILFIGTEVKPDEQVPAEKLIHLPTAEGLKPFRQLSEGDRVEAGQLLAQLDDRQARDEWLIRGSKLAAARADLAASEKTRDEAHSRQQTQEWLFARRATSREELRATELTAQRYYYEAVSKYETVKLAERERNQALTVLEMHQIRSAIPGVIKTIYKKPGEAVRALEPVFQIQGVAKLRAEGLLPLEYLPRLQRGMTVILEPSRSESPEATLLGHLQEITAVAVGANKVRPVVVSGSEDGSVRIWHRDSRHEQRVLWHPAPVRAVACSPSAAPSWCLTGAADGTIRLYDLDTAVDRPVRTFPEQHQGAVTCLAFSPDGKACVSGGEDREIFLWDPATGERRFRFPEGHQAAVTSLQFTPQGQLVSAGRDNTLRIWTVGTQGARLETTIDRRSGEVAWPGISPDGRHVLLDQGQSLRLLTLKDRLTECVLENSAEATQFSTFALFSPPDGRLILTAGAAEGQVQLWRAPTATTRPYELRQFVNRERSPATCAAFAPDGSFVVTGTKDRKVLIWPLPTAKEIEEQLPAELTLVERAVESSSRQVRIWAEVANPDGRLLPGTTVTLAIYPK